MHERLINFEPGDFNVWKSNDHGIIIPYSSHNKYLSHSIIYTFGIEIFGNEYLKSSREILLNLPLCLYQNKGYVGTRVIFISVTAFI